MPSCTPVRLLSWNILEGLHRRPPGQPAYWDERRRAAARAVIARERPDIVVLNEALWCRPFAGYHADYAHALGLPYEVGDLYDQSWGNAILSSVRAVSWRPFRIHNRGGLCATYVFDGVPLTVATYHPHPDRSPLLKAQDFASMLERTDRTAPLVVTGDFNAIAPVDQPDLDAMEKTFAPFSRDPRASADRFIQAGRRVFPLLETLGLRDGVAPPDRGYTIPTDVLSVDKSSGMRIDHAWVNAHVRVLSARIIRDSLTNQASDHYPILLDLDLAGRSPGG